MSETSELRFQLKRRARNTARKRSESLGDERCVNCGSSEGVEIHHRDGDWLNNHPMNLIPCCHGCHMRAHRVYDINRRIELMYNEFERLCETPKDA